jgi:microcin C transport system ATP-binding protein
VTFHGFGWTADLRLLFTCVRLFVSRVQTSRKPYMALLDIRNLTVAFHDGASGLPCVQDVSFSLPPGEILGLVGESGSGKTVIGLSIARLLPSPPVNYFGSQIILDGRQVLTLPARSLRQIRGRLVSFVFSDPGGLFNPMLSIAAHLRETLRLHQPGAGFREEMLQLLSQVGISSPETCLHKYPHQLSAMIQQRVAIAIAMASRPKLLIADEPTSAIDVTFQGQILDLFHDLRTRLGLSILILTRNPVLLAGIADHIAILRTGQIVECGRADEILRHPLHSYTRTLLDAVPVLPSAASTFI